MSYTTSLCVCCVCVLCVCVVCVCVCVCLTHSLTQTGRVTRGRQTAWIETIGLPYTAFRSGADRASDSPGAGVQTRAWMGAARELGIGLDFHVDESGLIQAECLRATAEAVLRNQFPHPVACGHNCSLSVQDPGRAHDTLALVKAAGIAIISLPLTNLHLQGRARQPAPPGLAFGAPRTPQWRGLTLLHECIDAGVTVACGGDNVRDAFIGWGDFDPVEVYVESVRIAQLDTRLEFSPSLVTTGPAAIMGLPGYGLVAPGSPADLIVFSARKLYSLLARPATPRRFIHGEGFREAALPDFDEQESWPKA